MDFKEKVKGLQQTVEINGTFQTRMAFGEMVTELMDCRNELCLRCEKYKEAHKGACDGCRWR